MARGKYQRPAVTDLVITLRDMQSVTWAIVAQELLAERADFPAPPMPSDGNPWDIPAQLAHEHEQEDRMAALRRIRNDDYGY